MKHRLYGCVPALFGLAGLVASGVFGFILLLGQAIGSAFGPHSTSTPSIYTDFLFAGMIGSLVLIGVGLCWQIAIWRKKKKRNDRGK